MNKQNAMQGVTKGGKDHDSTVDTTTKSGFFSAEETFHVVTIVTCQRDIVSEETLTNVFKPWFNNPRSVALHPPELPKVFHHLQVFCVLYTVTSTGLSTCCAFVYFLYSSYINTEPDKILLLNASRLAKNVTG